MVENDGEPGILQLLLKKRDFPGLIKLLDAKIKSQQEQGIDNSLYLILSRSQSYFHLGLYRKALKDLEQILNIHSLHATSLLLQSKILIALKDTTGATRVLRSLLAAAEQGHADLFTASEACDLLAALEGGHLKSGTKVPLFESSFAPCASLDPSPTDAARVDTQPSKTSTKTKDDFKDSVPIGQNDKELASMHRLVALTDPSSAINIAVNLVNAGQYKEAIDMLDLLISRNGPSAAPLAARGTARALCGDLLGAINDFDGAIEKAPNESDFYKRRAQALGALGKDVEALEDLDKSLQFSTDCASRAESLGDASRIHHKRRDYKRAELSIQSALELNPQLTALLPLLASCQVSQGNLEEGAATYEGLLQAGYQEVDAIINLGMVYKELCQVDKAEQMLRRGCILGKGTPSEINACRLIALMLQGLGDHLGAVRELDAALQLAQNETQRIELQFLRGACNHAVGLHRSAVIDYQSTLAASPEDLSQEAVSFMCLAFYQKEMALWARAHLDDPMEQVCLDADLHPEFKELWCKKTPPDPDFVAMYQTIMQNQHPNWDAVRRKPPPPPETVNVLVKAGDALGMRIQYHHQGFLPNRRQQRMAGLSSIEYAQLLTKASKARKQGEPPIQIPNAGASVCARGPSGVGGGGRGGSGTHNLGWRDAMEVLVKWRQIAEPNDQVLWVDLLTEKEFGSGFGSHTPMFTGQTKCVRYYMNFDRALKVAIDVAIKQGYVFDAESKPVEIKREKLEELRRATTAEELWHALGQDSYVVVPIQSTTRKGQGHILEGTRLTVVNLTQRQQKTARPQVNGLGGRGGGSGGSENNTNDEEKINIKRGSEGSHHARESSAHYTSTTPVQPSSFEFSIRTPVTPARWQDYDEELTGVFDTLLQALSEGNKPAAADAALRFAYYWYNFMPLARGSALCGYVSLIGTFLAMGTPIQAMIPPSYQTDWEAILESSPDAFIHTVGQWLVPPEVHNDSHDITPSNIVEDGPMDTSRNIDESGMLLLEHMPEVKDALSTMRERLEVLNKGTNDEDPRL